MITFVIGAIGCAATGDHQVLSAIEEGQVAFGVSVTLDRVAFSNGCLDIRGRITNMGRRSVQLLTHSDYPYVDYGDGGVSAIVLTVGEVSLGGTMRFHRQAPSRTLLAGGGAALLRIQLPNPPVSDALLRNVERPVNKTLSPFSLRVEIGVLSADAPLSAARDLYDLRNLVRRHQRVAATREVLVNQSARVDSSRCQKKAIITVVPDH